MDAARRSAASLAGDGTPGPPELNFLQLNLSLIFCPVLSALSIIWPINQAHTALS